MEGNLAFRLQDSAKQDEFRKLVSMPKVPGSWRGIVKAHGELPLAIQNYFEYVPQLVEEFPLEVCIAYQFARLELAYSMTIYCGVVKLHRVDPGLARSAVDRHHLGRKGFYNLYDTVFGAKIPKSACDLIEHAETVRDKIMHGKPVTEAEKRSTVVDVLVFADALDNKTNELGKIRPFGDLRGFKGRAIALDKSTSRWILKGMGLSG